MILRGQLRRVLDSLILRSDEDNANSIVAEHSLVSQQSKASRRKTTRLLAAHQIGSSHPQGLRPQRSDQMLACGVTHQVSSVQDRPLGSMPTRDSQQGISTMHPYLSFLGVSSVLNLSDGSRHGLLLDLDSARVNTSVISLEAHTYLSQIGEMCLKGNLPLLAGKDAGGQGYKCLHNLRLRHFIWVSCSGDVG